MIVMLVAANSVGDSSTDALKMLAFSFLLMGVALIAETLHFQSRAVLRDRLLCHGRRA
jgi:hypothetical protein